MAKTEKTGTEAFQRKSEPSQYLYDVLGAILLFGLPALWIWSLTPYSLRYRLFYSAVYSVKAKHVYIEKKPVDCDWSHAPLGDKDCHYEKQVSPMNNDRGRVTDVFVSWKKVPN